MDSGRVATTVPQLTPRFSTAKTPASTLANRRIVVFKYSKQLLSLRCYLNFLSSLEQIILMTSIFHSISDLRRDMFDYLNLRLSQHELGDRRRQKRFNERRNDENDRQTQQHTVG